MEASSFRSGLDADKPAAPAAGEIWLARDTGYLYVCNVAGSWDKVAKLYLLLAGGTMTGAIVFAAGQTGTYLLLAGGTMSGAIAMGTHKITGLDAPTDSADAARKSEVDAETTARIADVDAEETARIADVDAVEAKLDDVTWSEPARALDTIYQNTTGKILFVAATLSFGTSETIYGKIGSSSPPGTIVAYIGAGSGSTSRGAVSFIVPINWYYKLEIVAGTPTLNEWHEWALL